MKGKKLTVAQMKLLNKYGISNVEDWLYAKTVTKNLDGENHSSKNSEKKICMVIIHKHTSTMKEIPME